jgi:hypothetical protein
MGLTTVTTSLISSSNPSHVHHPFLILYLIVQSTQMILFFLPYVRDYNNVWFRAYDAFET